VSGERSFRTIKYQFRVLSLRLADDEKIELANLNALSPQFQMLGRLFGMSGMRRGTLFVLASGAVLGVAILFFYLAFWRCTEPIPTAQLLAMAKQEFFKREINSGDLTHTGVTQQELDARIANGESFCSLWEPETAPEGLLSVFCNLSGKDGRRSGVQYYMTPCGWIVERFLYNEST
jgi:hypothetical protein